MIRRIGYVQTEPVFGRVRDNVDRAIAMASSVDADLLVFPELFNTGYLFESRREVEDLAEPADGRTFRSLSAFASETSTAVVAGFAERGEGGKIYNSAMMIDETGDLRWVYRKTHLFDREKIWFDPGDTGFSVVELAGIRVGVMICFDWIFPESARVLALGGAQVLAHPANLVLPYAQTAMLTRSVENRVFTVTANRVGSDERPFGSISFTGRSQVTSPGMEVLVMGPRDRPHASAVEVDPSEADDKSITERNDLFSDRRVEFYGALVG